MMRRNTTQKMKRCDSTLKSPVRRTKSLNIMPTKNLTSLSLVDKSDKEILTFMFHNSRVDDIKVFDDTFQVIHDTFFDRIKKRLIATFLGITYDTCTTRYMIMKKKQIIAELIFDALEQEVRFKAKSQFIWNTDEDISSSESNTSPPLAHMSQQRRQKYSDVSDIIDTMCDKHDYETYMMSSWNDAHMDVRHTSFDNERRSAPL